WPRVDRSFFDAERLAHGGFGAKFYDRLGVPDGANVDALRPAIAAGMQRALEAAVLRIAGSGRHLCLAGGIGMNALLVRALETSGQFERVFVQPVAGNAGTALGAVAEAWHTHLRQERRI